MSIEGYRLSPQQRRLFRLMPGGLSFRVQCLLRLEGPVEKDTLRRALEDTVAAHESLRTTFVPVRGMDEPVQVIADQGNFDLEWIELGALPAAEREARAREHFQAASERPFSLETGPLLRVTVASLHAEEHRIGLVLPAVCADAATLRLLYRELAWRVTGRGALPEKSAPISYLSFAEWQHTLCEERAGGPAALRPERPQAHTRFLPLERRTNTPEPFSPASIYLPLEHGQSTRLEAAARALSCPLSALIRAVWVGLCGRLTGASEFTLGLFREGRDHPDLAALFGLLARWLPLRCAIHPDLPVAELTQDLIQAERALLEGEHSFVWEVQANPPVAGEDYPILGFRWSNDAREPLAGGALHVELEEVYVDRAKLCLSCAETSRGLVLELQYDRSLLTQKDARRIAAQIDTVLTQIAEAPETRLGALDLLGPEERDRLLVRFNATDQPIEPRCVHRWFEEQAARTPERVALVFEDQQLTYAELEARANQLSHALRRHGVAPELRVGLHLTRSIGMIVGMLATLKAGGAYVPLDPSLPWKRMAQLLDDIQAPVILSERRHLQSLPVREGQIVFCLDADEGLDQEPKTPPSSDVRPENAAYVLFTSGSTGRPKGVLVEHRQLYNYIVSALERLDLPRGAVYATVSSFAADLGNTAIFPALCTGSCLHIISAERAADPIALAAYTRRHPIDCLKIVPSHLRALLSAGEAEAILPRHRLILGGEAAPRAWVEELQPLAPGCQIYNHYGPTEATVGVMTYRFDPTRPITTSTALPLERPIANTRIYLLDAAQEPVPVGMTGHIYIAGAALARGYLNRSSATAESFLPDPHGPIPGARMYRTGDLGRHLPDGTIEFLGRADDQIKYHGYRIELAELRHALNQHPNVRDSVFMLWRDERGGEVLIAYYVSRKKLEREDLRAFLAEHVSEEVLPNMFVHLSRLPLTLNGKVRYDALPTLEEARQGLRHVVVPPRTPLEATLARIWCEVLNLPEVGVHDSFFGVGGDSILAILVISKANQAGLRLTPRQLFQHQTIEALARVATELEEFEALEELERARAQSDDDAILGPVGLTPIQRWFFAQEVPEPDASCVAVLLEARQPIDAVRLEQALNALLDHHDALRLRFARVGADWQATIAPPGQTMPFRRIDLSAVPDTELDQAIAGIVRALSAELRLDRGPVSIAVWIDRGPHRPSRLVLALHRLIIDGVSWRVLFEQLQTAYQELLEQGACRLPARTSSFKAWTSHLEAYAASPELREELVYWVAAFGKAPPPLPVDFPDAAAPLTLECCHRAHLCSEASHALLYELPQAYRCELGEILIAALVLAICDWSGHPALLLDVEGHGREELPESMDLSRTVGWFTALYPVLLTPLRDSGAGASLPILRDQLRAVPHRGLGYGVLKYLCPDPELVAQLEATREPEVFFRYGGQYQNLTGPWFSVLDDPDPPSPTRRHKIAVVARMVERELHLSFYYSASLYAPSTIERLAKAHLAVLEALLAERGDTRASPYASSDFPLSGLNQQKLDKLIARLGK